MAISWSRAPREDIVVTIQYKDRTEEILGRQKDIRYKKANVINTVEVIDHTRTQYGVCIKLKGKFFFGKDPLSSWRGSGRTSSQEGRNKPEDK